jgi:hypothetical protein
MAIGCLPCVNCGILPRADIDRWCCSLACSYCYDGAPDSGSILECGTTLDVTVGYWNERQREELPEVSL